MSSPQPQAPFPSIAPPSRIWRGPVVQFAVWALGGLALVAGVTSLLTGLSVAAMASGIGGYACGVALAIGLLQRGFPHRTLGACNVVTLTRLALAAALLAPLAGQPNPWAVFAVATIAFALDGADGWLARHKGRVSAFGARFDLEVDSGLALILALNAWAAGTVGAVVLLIGLPRYVFAVAGVGLKWLQDPLPPRFSRKAVCVVQLGAVIVLQIPILPPVLATPLVIAVTLALLWSFGRDVAWLWRHRI
jgi:phosphatidylglycerophosphate synthase